MKRNKYKDYLWYTALVVFVLCIIEGLMYYHGEDNTFLKISLNIQNAIKAYKIDPDIKQSEAISFLAESGGGILMTIITYLYCASVIVAPFCTIGALTVLILKPANYVKGLLKRRHENSILVLGSGVYKNNFIYALAKDCNVTVVEADGITEDRKLKYLNHGIKFVHKYYQQLYIGCNDSSMGEIIRQYYDRLDNKSIDINIIDINQMAVNKMFAEHPVFMANTKDNLDVHMGIIGCGEFGQRTLLQALNMSVLSAESKICIDVYDKDMDNIIGAFMKHFSVDILDGLKFVSEEIFLGEQTEYYEL